MGNLPGAAFLAGHRRVTTTALYIRAPRRAAERVLAGAGATGFIAPTPNPASRRNRKSSERLSLCEGGDLNPYESYPASTSIQAPIPCPPTEQPGSSWALPETEPAALLVGEAQALLDAAASQEKVEAERLKAFARACLELSEAGRLALAVLDGGLFASRRALELAACVIRGADEASHDGRAVAVKKTGA